MIQKLQETAETLTTLSSVIDASGGLLTSIMSFIGIASVIAKYLPPPESPGILALIHKWINVLAMNSGHAENKQQ